MQAGGRRIDVNGIRVQAFSELGLVYRPNSTFLECYGIHSVFAYHSPIHWLKSHFIEVGG
jgi:hypothetical protein